jgi:drug/metabolite transporter (DMT)-like permease
MSTPTVGELSGSRVTDGGIGPAESDTGLEPRRAQLGAALRRVAARLTSVRTWAFAAVYVIWGSTYLGIHIAVETIPPFLLAGCRSLLAGTLLLAYQLARGARVPNRGEWARSAVAGLSLLAAGNGLVTLAEIDMPSNLAALMIAGVPAYVALLDWWRPGGVRPSRRVLFGVVLGSLGMVLLVRPDPDTLSPRHWYGVTLMLLAGWAWAFGSLYSRYTPKHPSPAVAGAQQMTSGGAAMLLIGAGRGEIGQLSLSAVSLESALAFVYLTVFGSMLAFSAFNWLVTQTTPAQLATTAYVNPLVALVLGWVVLGETLHPVSLAGAALILAAVFVMLARSRAEAAPVVRAAPPQMQLSSRGR